MAGSGYEERGGQDLDVPQGQALPGKAVKDGALDSIL